MSFLSIGILVSGQGSVLKTVLRNCADGTIAGRVLGLASNHDCPALAVGRSADVSLVRAFPIEDYQSRSDRDAVMGAALREQGVNLVVVGGYDESLEQTFFDAVGVDVNVISMYPALLPAFGELPEAIGPALEAGVKTIGVTIHFRAPLSGSAGPIIAQEPLPVDIEDTVSTVMERVISLESKLLPRILQAFAEERIFRDGMRVWVKPRG